VELDDLLNTMDRTAANLAKLLRATALDVLVGASEHPTRQRPTRTRTSADKSHA
jgi:hypothetical protein